MTMILTRLMSRSSLPSRKCDFIVVPGDCQHCSGGSTGAIVCGCRVVMRGTSPTVREAQFVARSPLLTIGLMPRKLTTHSYQLL